MIDHNCGGEILFRYVNYFKAKYLNKNKNYNQIFRLYY